MNHFIIASWEPELKQKRLYRLPPQPIIPFNMRFPGYKKRKRRKTSQSSIDGYLRSSFMCSFYVQHRIVRKRSKAQGSQSEIRHVTFSLGHYQATQRKVPSLSLPIDLPLCLSLSFTSTKRCEHY